MYAVYRQDGTPTMVLTLMPVCRLQIFCELLVAAWLMRMRTAFAWPFACASRLPIAACAGSSCAVHGS